MRWLRELFKSSYTKELEAEVAWQKGEFDLSRTQRAMNEARMERVIDDLQRQLVARTDQCFELTAQIRKDSEAHVEEYQEIVTRHAQELAELKTAHVAELNRAIEEKQNFARQLEEFTGEFSTIRSDRGTESGSRDSQALERPNTSIDDLLKWAHLLESGAPFERVKARYALEQLNHENHRFFAEQARLRTLVEQLERDKVEAAKALKQKEKSEQQPQEQQA